MFLAELDIKADAWLIVIGFLIQGGALSALWILWRHHVKTVSGHKREIKDKDGELAAKDVAIATMLAAKDLEIKNREDACREELAECQNEMHDEEKAFRNKTEELLREALRHEAEVLNSIRAELRSGGSS